MKTGRLISKDLGILWLMLLLCSLPILFNPNSTDQDLQGTNKWNGAYGVQYPYLEDYDELESRGINLVVYNITTDPDEWERVYSATLEHDLDIIPVLWGVNQTAWTWNQAANEWELDIQKYPDSRGAQFLQLLRDHPDYLEHTFAIYAFHEPFNPENPELISPSRVRRFWQQIHEEEFPQKRLMIYGESISWNSACANGCVDFDAIGLYNFTRCGFFGLWQYRIIEAVPGNEGLLIRPGPCAYYKRQIIRAGEDLIDVLYEFSQQSPAAPDGSRTRFFALVQTFAQDNPGLIYRMPEAEEMDEWVTEIVYPKRDQLAGMQWYVFRFGDLYNQTLGDNRYDDQGADRWQTMQDVGEVFYCGGASDIQPDECQTDDW